MLYIAYFFDIFGKDSLYTVYGLEIDIRDDATMSRFFNPWVVGVIVVGLCALVGVSLYTLHKQQNTGCLNRKEK